MVKCADCGFLAFRHFETQQLVEATEKIRERGAFPTTTGSYKRSMLEKVPICFAMKYDLRAELPGDKDDPNGPDIVTVVRKERTCDGLTPWERGFSPKEHRERLDREWLLEWQTKREEADRNWRQEQEAKRVQEDREWREGQEDKARR